MLSKVYFGIVLIILFIAQIWTIFVFIKNTHWDSFILIFSLRNSYKFTYPSELLTIIKNMLWDSFIFIFFLRNSYDFTYPSKLLTAIKNILSIGMILFIFVTFWNLNFFNNSKKLLFQQLMNLIRIIIIKICLKPDIQEELPNGRNWNLRKILN